MEWQETTMKSQHVVVVFFLGGGKEEKPPGTYVPSSVLRKAKLTDGRSGQGDAKMAAEKKQQPLTQHPLLLRTGYKLSTLWLLNGRSLVRQLLTKDTPTPRTG